MKKFDYLVTGGAGFIGSNFVHHLLKETDSRVAVLDSLTYASNSLSLSGLDASRLTVFEHDLRESKGLTEIVDKCETIVHFAAESHNDNSLSNPQIFVETNVVGTFNLLESIRRVGNRLHHISTDEVFGDLSIEDEAKFSEYSPYNPSSPYSSTKAASDLLVRAWVRSFGLKATISNCSNNYGPRQHVEKFIPRQITNLLTGNRPVLYGSGENVRDWIYVDDHSSAILKILEKGTLGETYLIGAEGEKNNLQVLQMILELMGFSPEAFDFVEDRIGHDLRYAIDSKKIEKELGWSPQYGDFELGLNRTINWYKDNRAWWESSKKITESRYKGK